jgi:hypothetical protein
MKTSVQIIIAAGLFVLLAGTIGVCVYHRNSHHGMRGMRGEEFSHRNGMYQGGMRGRNPHAGMPVMRGMRPGMEQRQMAMRRRENNRERMIGMQRPMPQGRMNGMGRGMGMGMMPADSIGRGNMRQDRMMGMMPSLTEKQRKEIAELRQKQQEEMNKLRKEMSSKINALVQTQRDKVMELLTAEQRKALKSISGTAEPAPEK